LVSQEAMRLQLTSRDIAVGSWHKVMTIGRWVEEFSTLSSRIDDGLDSARTLGSSSETLLSHYHLSFLPHAPRHGPHVRTYLPTRPSFYATISSSAINPSLFRMRLCWCGQFKPCLPPSPSSPLRRSQGNRISHSNISPSLANTTPHVLYAS
jgi:hypothetical protein